MDTQITPAPGEAPGDAQAKKKDVELMKTPPAVSARAVALLSAPGAAGPVIEQQPLYSVWPARSRFLCKGKCLTGGEDECPVCSDNLSGATICIWACILVPFSVYVVFVLPWVWKEKSSVLAVVSILIFVVTIMMLLSTCLTDPGVIPRRELVLAAGTRLDLETILGYDLLGNDLEESLSASVTSQQQLAELKVPEELKVRNYKWCRTCHIVRPPRASHCASCDHCVLRFDHHCPFVNNCVGQRNYGFFSGFITSALCLAVVVLGLIFWWMNADTTGTDVSQDDPVFRAVAIVGAIGIGLVAVLLSGFWCYHMFLIVTGRTTKEQRRPDPMGRDREAEATLCGRRGPRLFDPNMMVDVEIQQGGTVLPLPKPSRAGGTPAPRLSASARG